MKLTVLTDLKINSIEGFALVSMVMGATIFMVTLFFDQLVGVQVAHNEGLGLGQILVLAASGLYVFWGYCMVRTWGE